MNSHQSNRKNLCLIFAWVKLQDICLSIASHKQLLNPPSKMLMLNAACWIAAVCLSGFFFSMHCQCQPGLRVTLCSMNNWSDSFLLPSCVFCQLILFMQICHANVVLFKHSLTCTHSHTAQHIALSPGVCLTQTQLTSIHLSVSTFLTAHFVCDLGEKT